MWPICKCIITNSWNHVCFYVTKKGEWYTAVHLPKCPSLVMIHTGYHYPTLPKPYYDALAYIQPKLSYLKHEPVKESKEWCVSNLWTVELLSKIASTKPFCLCCFFVVYLFSKYFNENLHEYSQVIKDIQTIYKTCILHSYNIQYKMLWSPSRSCARSKLTLMPSLPLKSRNWTRCSS